MSADEALLTALLEACRKDPDDDAPRLVWADAVGGERGELVVIQCDLARGGLAPAQAAARRQRERELLATYGRAWAGFGAFAYPFEFRRGFIEALEIDAGLLVDRREALFARAPLLRSVTVTGLTGTLDNLRRLLDSPAFFHLHGLDLRGTTVRGELTEVGYLYDPNSDEAARALVESGALTRLRAIGISESPLSAIGVRHLTTSGQLHRLERVWLHQRFEADEILGALFHASQLESLAEATEMRMRWRRYGSLQTLPPMAELHLSRINDHALATLGASRAATTVETLWLSGTLTGFCAFPRLRTLDFMGEGLSIGGVQLGDLEAMRGVDALPSLRRLRIPYHESESVLRVARTWGSQLEELTLWGTPEPAVLAQLQAHVAGEVRWRAKREVPARLL